MHFELAEVCYAYSTDFEYRLNKEKSIYFEIKSNILRLDLNAKAVNS